MTKPCFFDSISCYNNSRQGEDDGVCDLEVGDLIRDLDEDFGIGVVTQITETWISIHWLGFRTCGTPVQIVESSLQRREWILGHEDPTVPKLTFNRRDG